MAEIIAPRITVGLFMANSLGPLIRLLFKMIVTVPSSTPSQTLPTTANESDLVSIPRHEYAHQYLAQKRASFTSTATLAQSVQHLTVSSLPLANRSSIPIRMNICLVHPLTCLIIMLLHLLRVLPLLMVPGPKLQALELWTSLLIFTYYLFFMFPVFHSICLLVKLLNLFNVLFIFTPHCIFFRISRVSG